MALEPDFPVDSFAILKPSVRWYPGEKLLIEEGRGKLIPPLVEKVRRGVCDWREAGYPGASETSRSLLNWWFKQDHPIYEANGEIRLFRWYFAQREAVESVVWLYEVERARDPHALLRYDSSDVLREDSFHEVWTRYVLKLATGAGKTKVASLLMAWSYFHKRYEEDSPLSTNILLVAPNIIVLDRLRVDFDGARIFHEDPILPENGWDGRYWKSDFQLTVHVQDEIGAVSDLGNLFLTNIHRVGEGGRAPPAWDLTTEFLGPKPVGKTTHSKVDLGVIVRQVPDLLVINDEAHHVRPDTQWWEEIRGLHAGLQARGGALSAQLDLTATPRQTDGGIFVHTISDYPLVEAIAQRVVKTPVLPDAASRARLSIRQSFDFVERFEDHLTLGVIEWRQSFEELRKADKKAVLFVMTEDTNSCDEVAAWLERSNPDLDGRVLVIHTNAKGDISESESNKASKVELDKLRQASREIDSLDSPYRAVVSVMVLREGWDVRNVTTIVGLRPFAAKSNILPEQTIGRGLRRMFFGADVDEKVSVTGTPAFLDFVESIKNEGVELEHRPMGPGSTPAGPMVIEVDRGNPEKDIEALDIQLPKLKPRVGRDYKSLEEIDSAALPKAKMPLKAFTAEEQREIVFRNIHTEEVSHITRLDSGLVADWRNLVGWFAKSITGDLRLVGGYDVVFGALKRFIEDGLFDREVSLDDPNTLRNLSEIAVTRRLSETFKRAINDLTVKDSGTTEVLDRIKISDTRSQAVKRREGFNATKSMMNIVAGDNNFELAFAHFLEGASDVQAFFKNTEATGFKLEYQSAGGGIIRDYLPDFIARDTAGVVWIIETKGREDLNDPRKWDRLKLWCHDASNQAAPTYYRALFVREEAWESLLNPVRTLAEADSAFGEPG